MSKPVHWSSCSSASSTAKVPPDVRRCGCSSGTPGALPVSPSRSLPIRRAGLLIGRGPAPLLGRRASSCRILHPVIRWTFDLDCNSSHAPSSCCCLRRVLQYPSRTSRRTPDPGGRRTCPMACVLGSSPCRSQCAKVAWSAIVKSDLLQATTSSRMDRPQTPRADLSRAECDLAREAPPRIDSGSTGHAACLGW